MGLRSLYRESTSKNTWTALPIYRGHSNSQRLAQNGSSSVVGVKCTMKDHSPDRERQITATRSNGTTVFPKEISNSQPTSLCLWSFKSEISERTSACPLMISSTNHTAGCRGVAAARRIFTQPAVTVAILWWFLLEITSLCSSSCLEEFASDSLGDCRSDDSGLLLFFAFFLAFFSRWVNPEPP